MTYTEALKEANKVGAAHAEGDALLAQTIKVLAVAYPISPQMTYDGAKKLNLTTKQISKMSPVALSDLMFV